MISPRVLMTGPTLDCMIAFQLDSMGTSGLDRASSASPNENYWWPRRNSCVFAQVRLAKVASSANETKHRSWRGAEAEDEETDYPGRRSCLFDHLPTECSCPGAANQGRMMSLDADKKQAEQLFNMILNKPQSAYLIGLQKSLSAASKVRVRAGTSALAETAGAKSTFWSCWPSKCDQTPAGQSQID